MHALFKLNNRLEFEVLDASFHADKDFWHFVGDYLCINNNQITHGPRTTDMTICHGLHAGTELEVIELK